MSKINELAKEIPEEIRHAIRGLDSDHRAAIFIALYKYGELSFSDLMKKLEIGKAELYYHLKELTKSALVEHYYKRELGAEQYSFYSITSFGQNFIRILNKILRPKPLPPPKPLKPQLDLAVSRIELQIKKLNQAYERFNQKDKAIFAKITDAYSKDDIARANVLAKKLVEVRKMERLIINAEFALEQIVLRLRTVSELGDVVSTLGPAVGVLRSVRAGLVSVFPEAENELGEIGNVLSSVMIEAGQSVGMTINFDTLNEDAEKILTEAATVAEQRIKEKLPKMPTEIPTIPASEKKPTETL